MRAEAREVAASQAGLFEDTRKSVVSNATQAPSTDSSYQKTAFSL
jgi:hypothetical protein